jgi:NADH-quinone oxidoreductase subunit L
MLSEHFWHGAILVDHHIIEKMHHIPKIIKYLPMILSFVAISLAYILYLKGEIVLSFLSKILSPIKKILINKYYFDEMYEVIFIKPTIFISKFFVKTFDKKIIDATIPHSFVSISLIFAKLLKNIHSGFVKYYLLIMVLSIFGIISYINIYFGLDFIKTLISYVYN